MQSSFGHDAVADEAAEYGSHRPTDERNPRHPLVDLSRCLVAILEEVLRVERPDVAAGVADAAGDAEEKNGGTDELQEKGLELFEGGHLLERCGKLR